MEKDRILVVDDEARYVRAIRFNLEASGYEVFTASDGLAALNMVGDVEPDLVLLDVKMPGLDGFEVCQRIREFSTVPVILLTALAESADKVKGLDTGADDYVTKPFSADELLARVRAVLRRASVGDQAAPSPVFEAGEIRVDLGRQRVFVAGEEVDLTPTEYRLLSELVKNAGRVLVPEHLLDKVWGVGYEGETHLVWQAMHRLRRKVEPDPQNPRYIHTRPGIGYVFESP
jgi:two-component system KDP operon response regulator KdpE